MAMSQVCRRIVIVGAFSRSPHTGIAVPGTVPVYGSKTPVKRHRGEPGHTRDTRDTRAHAGIRITRTNLTTIHPNPKTQTRTKTATDSTAARTAASPESTGTVQYRALCKTPGGAGTLKVDTRDTRITRITQTNLTTIPHNHPDQAIEDLRKLGFNLDKAIDPDLPRLPDEWHSWSETALYDIESIVGAEPSGRGWKVRVKWLGGTLPLPPTAIILYYQPGDRPQNLGRD